MSKLRSEDAVLRNVHARLRARYGELKVVTGQGIARGQRVEFEDGGKRVRCVIKTSSAGRISFGRRPDGTWSGLSECDRVVVVAPSSLNGRDSAISMFEQHVLKDAFEANLAAQAKAGMEHLPCWIAPFHEKDRGARGTGDGFGGKALWTEALSAVSIPDLLAKPKGELQPSPVQGLTIVQAKEGLARTFGVRPDQIEITIRG